MVSGNSGEAGKKKSAEEPTNVLSTDVNQEAGNVEVEEESKSTPCFKEEQIIAERDKINIEEEKMEDKPIYVPEVVPIDFPDDQPTNYSLVVTEEGNGISNKPIDVLEPSLTEFQDKHSNAASDSEPLDVPEVEIVDFPDDQLDSYSGRHMESSNKEQLLSGAAQELDTPNSALKVLELVTGDYPDKRLKNTTEKATEGSAEQHLNIPEVESVEFPDDYAEGMMPRGVEISGMDPVSTKEGSTGSPMSTGRDGVPDTAGVTEHPFVEGNIAEPPFHETVGRGRGNTDSTSANIHSLLENDTSESPFNDTQIMEGEQNQNDEDGVATTNSQIQQDDSLLHIVSARLVEESSGNSSDDSQEPQYMFVVAKPLVPEHFCRAIRRSRTALLGILMLFFIIAGLGIGLGVTLGAKETERVGFTSSPTVAPVPPWKLRDLIVATFPSAATSLDGDVFIASPRRKALQWIYEDPSLHSYSESRIIQRWVLATLFYSTSGEKWKVTRGWLGTNTGTDMTENECLWEGLSCDQTEDVTIGITTISMEDNRLNGTLPLEIAWFNQSLKHIQLKNNTLNGTVPTELGLLRKIKKITLRINDLTGTIPTELGSLKTLEVLRLDQNQFTGTIPSELGMLNNASTIYVKKNKLCGNMPQEICELRSVGLEHLHADCIGSNSNIKCTCCTKCFVREDFNCSS